MYKMTLLEIAAAMGNEGEKAREAAEALSVNGYDYLEDEEHDRAEWNNIIDGLKDA